MTTHIYAPGTVVRNRSCLALGHPEGDVLVATSIDGGEVEQTKFCVPFGDIQPGRLEPPSPNIIDHPSAQDLLLCAYCLSLQRSRVIPKNYQFLPAVMALRIPRVRMLLADDVGLSKTIEASLIITELLVRRPNSWEHYRFLIVAARGQHQANLDCGGVAAGSGAGKRS